MSRLSRRYGDTFQRLLDKAERQALRGRGRPRISTTFFGASTILFDDGETQILIDGFFSRPSVLKLVCGKIAPNRRRISRGLAHAEIGRLAGVFVAHSHFDHAMDAPTIATLTGAKVYGSRSTQQLIIGAEPGGGQFQGLDDNPVRLGNFTIRTFKSAHSPRDMAPGTILRPFTLPAHPRNWRAGECYSFLIEHDGLIKHDERSILVHASAGFVPDAFKNINAKSVYLGVALLGNQSDEYMEDYWREVVESTNPDTVIPIHWDNLTRSIRRPVRPPPRWFDDINHALEFIEWKCMTANIELRLPLPLTLESPWRR